MKTNQIKHAQVLNSQVKHYASEMSSVFRPMASGFDKGSRSAKRLNQADMSPF